MNTEPLRAELPTREKDVAGEESDYDYFHEGRSVRQLTEKVIRSEKFVSHFLLPIDIPAFGSPVLQFYYSLYAQNHMLVSDPCPPFAVRTKDCEDELNALTSSFHLLLQRETPVHFPAAPNEFYEFCIRPTLRTSDSDPSSPRNMELPVALKVRKAVLSGFASAAEKMRAEILHGVTETHALMDVSGPAHYLPAIEFLLGRVVRVYNNYFESAVRMSDCLNPSWDTAKTTRSLPDEPDASVFGCAMGIYRRNVYDLRTEKAVAGLIFRAMENVLYLVYLNKLTKSNIFSLLAERDMSSLKRICDFLIDVKTTEENAMSIAFDGKAADVDLCKLATWGKKCVRNVFSKIHADGQKNQKLACNMIDVFQIVISYFFHPKIAAEIGRRLPEIWAECAASSSQKP